MNIEAGDKVTKIGVVEDAEWTVTKIGVNDIGWPMAHLETFDGNGLRWTDRLPIKYLTKVTESA